jgi:hypothetical protein
MEFTHKSIVPVFLTGLVLKVRGVSHGSFASQTGLGGGVFLLRCSHNSVRVQLLPDTSSSFAYFVTEVA